MPRSPSSPSFATTASGIQPSASHCPACGSSSAWAKSRAVSRIIRCSSVRKSVCARASIVLFRVFFDLVDLLLRLLVEVGFHSLGGLQRLHLRAVGPLLGAFGRFAALGGRVRAGRLRLAAGGGEQRRCPEGRGPTGALR